MKNEFLFDVGIVAIDFDETIYTNGYPNIEDGEFIEGAINGIKEIQDMGYKTILWTCRSGEYLKDAIEVCENEGIIFDKVNENLLNTKELAKIGFDNSKKIYADIYIEDRQPFYEIDWGDIIYYIGQIYDERGIY